ncbi:DUF4255 domain-containing protein [Amycolatopsis sp. BJA-103]|uniref:DUF4255 domain-containing protein n=1 Tax=unclassified Amycolatopsis TaxID=2618356 RepID=UPI000CA29E20|nr:DUF4255 domain-containing protein [Amycolatopsis sp. BJA-103]AUI58311.1 hypothetical protein BKN51_08825 [Amycolatopsis sp. BJA-103]PNE14825.1 hypothetical protein B1H26_33285 [Amycolatopsis sp. BJA-103]
MFDEVDIALRSLLRESLPPEVVVRFDTPGENWIAECSGTETVGIFLHRVREDVAAGTPIGWSDERAPDGRVVRRTQEARRYELCYLVTAWADDIEREHLLLGAVLSACTRTARLSAAHLTGTLSAATSPVTVSVARPGLSSAPVDIWAALGLVARGCLDLVVVAPLAPPESGEPAPPPDSVDLGARTLRPPRPSTGGMRRLPAKITEGVRDGQGRGENG